jgi:hypothetical protein
VGGGTQLSPINEPSPPRGPKGAPRSLLSPSSGQVVYVNHTTNGEKSGPLCGAQKGIVGSTAMDEVKFGLAVGQ